MLLEPRLVRFKQKGTDRFQWVSTDKRWFIIRVVKDPPNYFVWLIKDLQKGLEYEKRTIIEAVRMVDRKVQWELQQSTQS